MRQTMRQTAAGGAESVPRVEWPTLALYAATVLAWGAATFAYRRWPLVVVAPLTAVILTLHSSLQHELVHGHPTRSARVNRWLGLLPLSLWLPFDRYRDTHLQHHLDARLTDPLDDPESYYLEPERAAALGRPLRILLDWQQTLLGRVMIGSFFRIGLFLRAEAAGLVRGEPGLRAAWFTHLACCIPVVWWVGVVCDMPLWLYVAAMVVPGNGILLIRSFAEHRAARAVRERIALVEDSRLLGPLFLYNNLHALHHEAPMVPWYRYNTRYRRERARLIAANGGLVYRSYFDVARRYLLRPHDTLEHPAGRIPPTRE